MTAEMQVEAVEMVTMAVDKFVAAKNYEVGSWLPSIKGDAW